MRLKWIGTLLFLATAIILVVECCRQPAESLPKTGKFAGNEACQKCHQQEHEQWTGSHHYMAMLPANDSTVLGNFDDATHTADGVTSRFYKRDGKFYIETDNEKGALQEFEVKYTFGFTPLQQYLVEYPGGRMQVPRVSWDSREGKWFNQYAGQKIPAGDWLHWTGAGQNWNTMCASCHSTNLQKGYDHESDAFQTTYNDINVSCESCHGAGQDHIQYIESAAYKKGERVKGSLLWLYKNAGQTAEINTCANCHARRVDVSGSVIAGSELLNDFIPELPTTEYFFADGQMNDEDYNYTSFVQSKMFHRGVQCGHCHNPHSGKLKLNSSLVCGQCHAPEQYAVEKHTMHPTTLNEVNCVSCHMPSKVYMGNDLRHDHSFRIPRPDLTQQFGTPNTCNSCHSNETAAWAAAAITKHYGKQPEYHWSEDLIPGSRSDEKSYPHLARLLADTSTPAIVKASALHYLARINSPEARNQLLGHLNNPHALVRYHALRGLKSTSASLWLQEAAPLLADEVKSVRLAAAQLFLGFPEQQVPAAYFPAFQKSRQELYAFTLYQTDFALGNLQAGDYFNMLNDGANAEKFYRRAVAKDSQMAIARVNLASLLNQKGANDEAMKQLQLAVKLEPESDHIYYSLGLLNAEMGNLPEASKNLKKAIALNPSNIRAAYNFGLLLQQQGQAAAAEAVFLNGLNRSPNDGDLLNALTILYLQQNQPAKARETGTRLKQQYPNDERYQAVYQQLGLR